MDFLKNFIQLDPVNNTFKALLIIFLLSFILIVIGFYLDFLKNKQNEKKLNILERAIKDLIEEFRTIELSLSDQKKILNNYKYTLERLDQEISRLADSSEGDSNITNAIKILTLSIIKRALKRGAAIINALKRILVRKNASNISVIFCRPKPGIISLSDCSICYA